MNTKTLFLARLIGLTELIIALAMLMHKPAFIELITGMLHDLPVLFLMSILMVVAGLAIVLNHNIWSGGALPVVVTIVGWAIFIKGLMTLFFPAALADFSLNVLQFENLFYLYAVVPLVLGVYLTWEGFRRR